MPKGIGTYGSKVGRPKMSAIAGKKLVKKKKPVKKKTYRDLYPMSKADKGIQVRKAAEARREKTRKGKK
tara:strand:- start:356 stop:562 length:207 start_codon:yes stop_codon:yes gene_type:complete